MLGHAEGIVYGKSQIFLTVSLVDSTFSMFMSKEIFCVILSRFPVPKIMVSVFPIFVLITSSFCSNQVRKQLKSPEAASDAK